MSDQIKLYTDEQLRELTSAVKTGLRMTDEQAQDFAEYILKRGELGAFGYGSLVGSPVRVVDPLTVDNPQTVGPVKSFPGSVQDLAIGCAEIEIYYRGTMQTDDLPENLHLTATAEHAPGKHIDGLVQIYWKRAAAETTQSDILFLTKWINDYAERESGPDPELTTTYNFVPFDIIPANADEQPVKAIVAIADKKRPNYMGPIDESDPYDLDAPQYTDKVTWADFAALEALASGPDYNKATKYGHEERPTGASYWRFLVSNWTNAGIELPDKPHRAVLLMNTIRHTIAEAIEQNNPNLTPEIRRDFARLTELEARPKAAAHIGQFHRAAFEMTDGVAMTQDMAIAMVLAAREKISRRWHAQLDAHFGTANRPGIVADFGAGQTGGCPPSSEAARSAPVL